MPKLSILDPIGTGPGELSAKEFKSQLEGLEGDLVIEIHSEGGDIIEGFAIHDALKEYPGRVTTKTVNAFSIASIIALAGDDRQITENGHFMIHNGMGGASGTAAEMRQSADLVEKMTNRMVDIYANTTGIDREEVQRLMDRETWFDADEALTMGLATAKTEPVRMAAAIDWSKYRHAPCADKTPTATGAVGDEPDTTKEGDPVSKVEGKKPATIKQLKAACPKASSDFLLAMAEEEVTEDEARAEYVKELESKLAAMDEYEQKCTSLMEENEALKSQLTAMDDEEPEAMEEEPQPEAMEEEEEEAAPAATTKAIRRPASNRKINAAAEWRSKVGEIAKQENIPRHKAVARAARLYPELRAEMVKQANAGR